MKIQSISTNYLTATNQNSKIKTSRGQNLRNTNFKGFPLLHEREGRFWKITGKQILEASKEQLKNWAEYLHKEEYLSEEIYTITKPHWWSGTKVDEFNTGIAYEKISAAIERVKEYKKTAGVAEVERLNKKADRCEEDLTEIRKYYTHEGAV